MAETTVSVKFDGQAHQVDINTFTQVILDYSKVLQAAADAAGIDDPVKICITATEPGSLDVIMSVIAEVASGALDFLSNNRNGLEAAVIIAGGLYGLKQKIAGKKKVEKVEENASDGTVTLNAEGDVFVVNAKVFNLYKDRPDTTEAIDNSFSALAENPAIEGIEMSSGGSTVFRAERDEFSAIATSPNYENENVRHNIEKVWLTVVKPFLAVSKTRKWEFVYNGSKITAPIVDEKFLGSLEQVPFRMGTKMLVELDVVQEYEDLYKAYLNKKFTILRVIEVEDPPQTEAMF